MAVTEARSAVRAARRAFAAWARTAPEERAQRVRAAADALQAHADELAAVHHQDTGRPVDEARAGIDAGIGTLRQYAELGPVHRGRALQGSWDATDLMIPQPRGVVVALTPWNDPVAVSCGLIGAALVTGNTVVHKPSERAAHTGAMLGRLLAEHLPDGVLHTVDGDGAVGAVLAECPDVDVIAHVGGTASGRAIATAAARTGAKALLENGGNDPLIVDADVDPAWAAGQAALGAFANAGQICTSVERVYVHQAIAEPFVASLIDEARRWDGPPLVDRAHRDTVHAQVVAARAAGARVEIGGDLPDGPGSAYPATVLTGCSDDMAVMAEETFGPVAPIRVVPTFADALDAARGGGYGLAATVLTGSMAHAQQAWRALPVGTVKVNAVFGGAPGGAAEPRGRSGTGFGYGPELLDELTTVKVVHIEPPGKS